MASKSCESDESDIFISVELSIKSTFNSLLQRLSSRRDQLLIQLHDIKMDFLSKEETRKKHLSDLDQLISQLEEICLQQNKIAKLQEEHIEHTKKERDQYLAPTSHPFPSFHTDNLVKFQQLIDTFGELNDLKTYYKTRLESVRVIGDKGAKFNRPYGIALDGKGNMLVADGRNHKVQMVDMEGSFIAEYGKGEIKYADGIVLHGEYFFVSEEKSVYKFHTNQSKSVCKSELEFKGPLGMTVWGDELYVADCNNHRIAIVNLDFKPIRNLGEGVLNEPADVEINLERVFVVDNGKQNNVHVFSKSGDLLNSIISLQYGFGSKFICFDKFNNLVLSDCRGGVIQIYTLEGELVHTINCYFRPTGILVDRDSIVCVDSDNNMIRFY